MSPCPATAARLVSLQVEVPILSRAARVEYRDAHEVLTAPAVRVMVMSTWNNSEMTTDEGIDEPRFANDEGWFTDPWGRHQARWISAGKATDLVRDGHVVGHEDPPATAPTIEPTRIPAEALDQVGAEDLNRADGAHGESVDPSELQRRLADASSEGVEGSWG